MFNRSGKRVHRYRFTILCGVHGNTGGLLNPISPQCGNFHNRTSQFPGKFLRVNGIAILAYHVHHVNGNDNGDSQFRQLGGQIQIALQIGSVNDVQNAVGTFINQVIPRHDFLKGVRRKRVNAG